MPPLPPRPASPPYLPQPLPADTDGTEEIERTDHVKVILNEVCLLGRRDHLPTPGCLCAVGDHPLLVLLHQCPPWPLCPGTAGTSAQGAPLLSVDSNERMAHGITPTPQEGEEEFVLDLDDEDACTVAKLPAPQRGALSRSRTLAYSNALSRCGLA